MGYLFPVNPVTRNKTEAEQIAAIEKIGEYEEKSRKDQQKQDSGSDQLESKIKKLINDKKILEAIELSDLDENAKSKLLEIVKKAAASFLKKELLSIAKSILSISVNERIHDEVEDKDLAFSDYLARLVVRLATSENIKPHDEVVKKVGKTNPVEDKNAGFLVHYCKDILNHRIKQQKNVFKSEKINKKDIDKYLKK